MIVAVPKEIKNHEYRVGLTPYDVGMYKKEGHQVLIEGSAGIGAGFSDQDYIDFGAEIVPSASDIYGRGEMIVKVKEPLPAEYDLLKPGQLLYTYLHLAANLELTEVLLEKQIISIAYETIELNHRLPCLEPMSSIAGRLAIQGGAHFLENPQGGRGTLLGGVPGISPGHVTILGAGTVGFNALQMAVGMGASVSILDINMEALNRIDALYGGRVTTLLSHPELIKEELGLCDLLIGAVLVPGAKAPQLVKRSDLALMKKASVLVDVAVDQGGCIESSHPTSHDAPTFLEQGIVHYCVANMPGAVALSSTRALCSRTINYGVQIASMGINKACLQNEAIMKGLNTLAGFCTHKGVSEAWGLNYRDVHSLFAS